MQPSPNVPDGKNINPNNPQEPGSQLNLAPEEPKLKRIKTRNTIVEQKEDEDIVYEQVKNSRFKQQRLPAWRPVPTIMSIIIVFSVFGLIFIVLGIILLVYSNKVHSAEVEYQDCTLGLSCEKEITIDNDIDGPVFVYYQLDGFFQNSRRYVKSKDIDQLRGKGLSSEDNCEPIVKNSNLELGSTIKAIDGTTTLNSDSTAIPCGLMAKTFFNDAFEFYDGSDQITVDETGISFSKDRELFKKNEDVTKQWLDMTNEHFLVWMRPSGLPNPKKLWGKIDKDLKKGSTLKVKIDNKYNVTSYGGKKKIVLSNATAFGGKNKFLGISYIVVGGLSIICAIIFPIGYRYQLQKEKEL